MCSKPAKPMDLACLRSQGNRRTMEYIKQFWQSAVPFPSVATQRSCLRFWGAARHLRRGGRDLGRLTTRPGEGPPQTPSCSEPAHHDNINVCTLSHARDIWALYSLLDGEPSQPSTGIRSIPDHFSSIGWPRLVPSLKPGDFKQPGSLLRQLLLA